MKRRNKGFTLIELIVVVAILVLLMLMLVPRLTGFTKTASVTVCNANVANAYKIMVMEYSLGKKPFTEDSAREAIKENLGDPEKLCPLGGEIIVDVPADSSKFTIYCKEHGQSDQQKLANYSGDVLKLAVSKYYNNKTGQLDSTGPNFGVNFKKEIAELYNLDVNNFDFAVSNNGSSGYSVYIFDGISNMEVNAEITGVVYTFDKSQQPTGNSAGTTFKGKINTKNVDGTQIKYLDTKTVTY